MKQMKKLLALLMVLMMVLALAACGNKGTATDVEEKGYVAGTVEGNTYTSEALGVTLTLDEGWVFLGDEEIAEMSGMVQDMTDSEALKKAMESGATIYDAAAVANDFSGRNINITVSDLGAIGGLTSEEAYAAAAAEQMKLSLESIGAENVEVETTTYTLGGTEHSGLNVKSNVMGMRMYQRVICAKVGKLIYGVTCTAMSEEELPAMMEMFRAL